MPRWTICDDFDRPYYLSPDDRCGYWFEYYPGEGFSNGNSIVLNFKKPISKKNTPEWRYKEEAVSEFANILKSTSFRENTVITAACTSKSRSDPNYDNRLDWVLHLYSLAENAIPIIICFDTISSSRPVHESGIPRTPDILVKNIKLMDFQLPPETQRIIIIDDVITTGGHFVAMKKLMQEKYKKIQVGGLFLAKTVHNGSNL